MEMIDTDPLLEGVIRIKEIERDNLNATIQHVRTIRYYIH